MQKGGIRNPYFDRSLKYKNEVPVTTFSFLFSEMIQYIMTKHNEDKELDLEEKLVSANLDYLKDLGVENYKEIFNSYYGMFLMDNSSFTEIFKHKY